MILFSEVVVVDIDLRIFCVREPPRYRVSFREVAVLLRSVFSVLALIFINRTKFVLRPLHPEFIIKSMPSILFS